MQHIMNKFTLSIYSTMLREIEVQEFLHNIDVWSSARMKVSHKFIFPTYGNLSREPVRNCDYLQESV